MRLAISTAIRGFLPEAGPLISRQVKESGRAISTPIFHRGSGPSGLYRGRGRSAF